MPTSLLSLVGNFFDRVYSDKCTDCKSCLGYILIKNDQLIFKRLQCNKNHNKDFKIKISLIDLQAHLIL